MKQMPIEELLAETPLATPLWSDYQPLTSNRCAPRSPHF